MMDVEVDEDVHWEKREGFRLPDTLAPPCCPSSRIRRAPEPRTSG